MRVHPSLSKSIIPGKNPNSLCSVHGLHLVMSLCVCVDKQRKLIRKRNGKRKHKRNRKPERKRTRNVIININMNVMRILNGWKRMRANTKDNT